MSRLHAAALGAALFAAANCTPADAAVATFRFDNTPDNAVSMALIGSGTFSFDGAPVGDSTVPLSSLSNVAFSFTVGGLSFTLDDLDTPRAHVQVRFKTSGKDLLVSFGGSGGGTRGGSADFSKGANFLSFQPDFGGLFVSQTSSGFVAGDFDALIRNVAVAASEPVSLALVALGLAAAAASRRRIR